LQLDVPFPKHEGKLRVTIGLSASFVEKSYSEEIKVTLSFAHGLMHVDAPGVDISTEPKEVSHASKH
jgi:hypothetical protein